jgi:two-component system cell cycle sensor histidine kinase/response regulator CckA
MHSRRDDPLDSRFLFDLTPDGILIVTAEGRILDANSTACELLGYTHEELVGLETSAIVASEDLDAHRVRLVAARSGDNRPSKRRMRRKDGTLFTVEGSGVLLPDGRIVGLMRDAERLRLIELFQALIERASDMVSILSADGTIRYLSPSVSHVLGYESQEMVGRNILKFVHPDDRPAAEAGFDEALASSEGRPFEVRYRARDGSWRLLEGAGTNRLDDPAIQGVVVNLRDVTERRRAEEALRHSEERFLHAQRLESVGRLAGGVAHDFNNLLTVILAFSDQQVSKLEAAHPLYRSASEIRKAAVRAADLTRQLLAFSRRQVLEPRALDLNAVLADLEPLLRRLVGGHTDLVFRPAADPALVRADPGQIQQVIMNLVVNASDAMPHGGRIALSTREVDVQGAQAARLEGLAPGRYVTLAVSDGGIGMDAETRSRLFEPFFTTKERGKGTGLGLSTVYGIIQQSGGAIEVESEPGEGSTFSVYLPRIAEAPEEREAAVAPELPRHGTETVLLVEDEVMVRELMSEMLLDAGYRVIETSGGREAFERAAAEPSEIHLLLSDVMMPGITGPELAQGLAKLRPAIRVLFVSGYTQELVAQRGGLEPGVHLLQKPFDPETFTRKVREVLDEPRRHAA